MCLCFYSSGSLKLWPVVPSSASSMSWSLGWISAMCWTCSIPDSPLVCFVLGFSASYNLLAPSSWDSCRGATLLQQGKTETGLVMLCWQ